MTSWALHESSVSRFSVLLLPYICPVVGSVRRFCGRYRYCALDGVALTDTMYSGAMVARIIVATEPLGAMRVSSFGICTVRPRESVKATVSSPAAAPPPDEQPLKRLSIITMQSNMENSRFIICPRHRYSFLRIIIVRSPFLVKQRPALFEKNHRSRHSRFHLDALSAA
jgi:hypothetical protein